MGKEECQNSNNGVEFSQKCQKSGRVFVKSRQGSVQSIVFVEKSRHQHSSGHLIFHKNVIGEASVREGQKCSQPIVVCEKSKAPKSLEFLVPVFLFL